MQAAGGARKKIQFDLQSCIREAQHVGVSSAADATEVSVVSIEQAGVSGGIGCCLMGMFGHSGYSTLVDHTTDVL